MEQGRPGRKGCGRRRIEIKRIENQRKRWVAFSKRKKGLLSKADCLSRMSGEDIGIVIISEQGRVYTSDNADAVIHRYMSVEEDNKNNVGRGKERLENRSQQEASTSVSERLRRSDCHNDDDVVTVASDASDAVTHGYRSQRIVKERETLSLLCRQEGSSTCLHDNNEDASFVKRSTDDVHDKDGDGTDNHRRDDHDNRNEMTILKFKSLWLEHQQRTLTTTTDYNGDGDDGGYNGCEDTDTNNEKYKNRKEEQDVIPFIDFLKIKDEEIKGENYLFDLNKIPNDSFLEGI
ncbi:hypothetical protein V6N13_012975 [Hibiscus sabdariffa]|uniref:MADS-box domain-containing protein n=1 Tax=Hibiscus sabdariffa TaxID=183260 RepID=A0ABR2SH04_9ROSI